MQHIKQILRAAKGNRDDKVSSPSSTRKIADSHMNPTTPSDHVTIQHQETATPSAAQAALNAANAGNATVFKRIPPLNRPMNKKYPGLKTRYQLNKRIGDGAFSVVYHAHDLDGVYPDGVAIKIVYKSELGNKQRSNILKETAIQKRMKHDNIVNLIEYHEDNEHMFIVLEYVPGGELFHQIVKLTYFSEELCRHVIIQVAEAIRYMHIEQGVVHRDIKPENILYTPIPITESKVPRPQQPGDEGKVDEGEFIPGYGGGGIGKIKIADFGLSKIVWQNDTKTPCGTAGYTAPEIVREDTYSQGVDMWAMGCVLYTILCGFPPFYDENLQELSDKVKHGQFTFLSPWWDNISDEAKDLVTHLLVVDPKKRYDIMQFLEHPWITQQKGPLTANAQDAPRAFNPHTVIDSSGLTFDPRSPDAINLREVFDISYDVARRVQTPFVGVDNMLSQVQEEDEDTAEETVGPSPESNQSDSNSGSDMQYTGDGTKQLEHGMQHTRIADSQPRTAPKTKVRAAGGYGQHSADVVPRRGKLFVNSRRLGLS